MAINSEIDALKVLDEALSAIDKEAQVRVLEWANSKFLGSPITKSKFEPTSQQIIEAPTSPTSQVSKKKPQKSKPTKKPKTVIKQVKDLDLHPKGKISAKDFVAEKQPTNTKQKCVVALHYLLNTLELEVAGIDHIYTFFKGVGWPAPTNLPNTLHQAGSAGWLDTANAADIKITPLGENEVEHHLPKQKKV
ncbi:MAG: hypothetical protein IV108_05660 [Burkholderiales bacterium]|nr:hypothetical protein [Burkholderiales bacterium]